MVAQLEAVIAKLRMICSFDYYIYCICGKVFPVSQDITGLCHTIHGTIYFYCREMSICQGEIFGMCGPDQDQFLNQIRIFINKLRSHLSPLGVPRENI